MKGKGNRQKILNASIELFNRDGTVVVTTNHIARYLSISPGNLYFHFDSKEHIIRELFGLMTNEVHALWGGVAALSPHEFLEGTFELFWKYRFFHREMYHLRRQDDLLSKHWKAHMSRCLRLLRLRYAQWVHQGQMRLNYDPTELKMLSDCVLLVSNASLGFFEGPEKPASRRSLRPAIERVHQLLWPYYTQEYRAILGEASSSLRRSETVLENKILDTPQP